MVILSRGLAGWHIIFLQCFQGIQGPQLVEMVLHFASVDSRTLEAILVGWTGPVAVVEVHIFLLGLGKFLSGDGGEGSNGGRGRKRGKGGGGVTRLARMWVDLLGVRPHCCQGIGIISSVNAGTLNARRMMTRRSAMPCLQRPGF